MDETVNNKKNLFTIALIILNVLNVILFSIYAYQSFYSDPNEIFGYITIFFVIVTFIYTAYVVGRRVSKKFSLLILLDILFIFPGFFVFVYGGLQRSFHESEARIRNEVSEMLETVSESENIRKKLVNEDYYFYDERCKEAGIRCIDKNNRVRKYVNNLDFYEEDYSDVKLSDTIFNFSYSTSNYSVNYSVTFLDDFSGFQFHGDGKVRSSNIMSKTKIFRFDHNHAKALKNIVDEIIVTQIENHTVLLDEAKSKVSMNYVLDIYQQFEEVTVSYRSPQYEYLYNTDDNRKILSTIIEMDKSNFRMVKKPKKFENRGNNIGFIYSQKPKNEDYEITFSYDTQELCFIKYYQDFDDETSYVILGYEVGNENTNLLMRVAKEAATKQNLD